jgi:prolyl 4-hydroxylase
MFFVCCVGRLSPVGTLLVVVAADTAQPSGEKYYCSSKPMRRTTSRVATVPRRGWRIAGGTTLIWAWWSLLLTGGTTAGCGGALVVDPARRGTTAATRSRRTRDASAGRRKGGMLGLLAAPAGGQRSWRTTRGGYSISSTAAAAAAALSNDIAHQAEQEQERVGPESLPLPSLHTHEFWRKARTTQSIQEHVLASLHHVATTNEVVSSIGMPTVDVLSSDPPLIVIHDFLTQRDCEDIMDAAGGSANGLQRSTTGAQQEVGTGRTSSTVWLKDDECQIPLRRIASMVSAVSGLPPSHMENLQVCKYLPGQEFKLHTDHQDSYNDLEWRGRLATCLIYLSSATEGMSDADAGANALSSQPRGGETWFPGVRNDADGSLDADADDDDGLSISPRQGSAVFFWNTLEKPGMQGYDPLMFLKTDTRLRHAGLPVLAGEKWICNRWVHPIDFGSGVRGV